MNAKKQSKASPESTETAVPSPLEVVNAVLFKDITSAGLVSTESGRHPLVDYFRQHGELPNFENLSSAGELEALLQNRREAIGELAYRGKKPSDLPAIVDQLIGVTIALFAGAKAAQAIIQGTSFADPKADCVKDLTTCLQQYHQTWGWGAREISLVTAGALSKAGNPIDAALASCVSLSPNHAVPAWFNESNYLTVRRLLSYLTRVLEEEPKDAPIGTPTDFNRLTILGAGNDADGASYEVLIQRRQDEHYPSMYLDPVTLGVKFLDEKFISSMRIAARVCRGELERGLPKSGNSLRVSPLFKDTLIVEGGSAGGFIACGAIATAWGERINRKASASITIDAPISDPNDANEVLPKEAIVLGAVKEHSIAAKIAAAVKEAKLTELHFHEDQLIKRMKTTCKLSSIKAEIEGEYSGLRLYFHTSSDNGI